MLFFVPLVGAAPSKQALDGIGMVFDYHASDDLAALQFCGKPALHNQYLQSLSDAGVSAPQRDPKKIRALIQQIQRKSDLLVSIRERNKQYASQE